MAGPRIELASHQHPDGGEIARVTIVHPARLNALGRALSDQLAATFEQLAGNAALRAVVLTGAGERAFVSGADLHELAALTPTSAAEFINRLHAACRAVRALPVPVIARIRGPCLGAGLELALSCDIRVADAGALFGMPEVRVGVPSVIEAALLPAHIGWGRAREMLLTGRTYGAHEAAAMGLVERVVAPERIDDQVAELIEAIGAACPQAVRAQKALLTRWQTLSVAAAAELGAEPFAQAYQSGEPRRRIEAFLAARGKRTRQ